MAQNKFIDKSYLISSLKNFDSQVLEKKYGKNNENETHKNQAVLDKLTESDDGMLLFNGNNVSGTEGKTGKSAYEVALENGFSGTETEWLQSLKGAKGDKGDTGAVGAKGDTGAAGAAAGFGTPTATIDANTGTPSVTVTASGSNTSKVFNFAFKNLKGEKGDTGTKGATGNTGATGATGARGSRWNTGTAITGTATTGTIFSGSGITDALVNDMYMNTSTFAVYKCTTAGTASVAKWSYIGTIKGAKGDTGDVTNSEHYHGDMMKIKFSATEPTTIAVGEIVMVYEE